MTIHKKNIKELEKPLLGYQLVNIELVDFELKSKRDIDPIELGFAIEVKQGISQDGTIQVDTKVNIAVNQTGEVLSSINIICTFFVDNYQHWLESQHQSNGALPTGLAQLLSGISLSTLRGVMFCKLQGSYLDSVVLPIIDLQKLQPQ